MAKKFLVLLLLLGLAGGGAFWYWTGTPQYSMLQLSDAVRKHDGLAFRNYFDVDGVSAHAVDDLLSESVREIGGAGLLQKLIGLTFARIFKPELGASLSKKIMTYVETPADANSNNAAEEVSSTPSGSDKASSEEEGPITKAVEGFVHKIAEAIKPPSLREVLHELGITKDNFKGFTDYEVSGDLCHVGLKFQPPEKSQVVVMLELQKKDQHWQVVRFANLDQIARTASGI